MPTHKTAIDRMVGTRETLLITGLPISTIYAGMKAGWFPRNRKISPKRVAWRESELRAFIETRQTYSQQAA